MCALLIESPKVLPLSRPWIARILLAALTLEMGLMCSLYTGDFPFLHRVEEGVFRFLLSRAREVKSEEVILEINSEGDQWSLRGLKAEEVGSPWAVVEVPFTSELFDGSEPSPSEYAILLAKLHQAGARQLAFTQSLTWKEAPELELLALDSALRPFSNILLPVDVTEVPRPENLPGWLKHSLIPMERLQGDASRLPLVNQIVISPSVSGRAGLVFALPDFGGRDLQFRAPERLPLFARWEDQILPSWPLALAMRLEGVSSDELEIEPGRHLRLGKDGPVIPLDDFGRAKVPAELPRFEEELISAKTLFPIGEAKLPVLLEGAVVLDSTSPQAKMRGQRLLSEAQALRQFPRPGREEVFRRLSLKWEIFLYLEIALVAIFALHLRPMPQLIALAVLCVALLVFILGLLHWRSLWTPVLPLVAASTMSWCLVGYLQQIAHPVRPRKSKKA